MSEYTVAGIRAETNFEAVITAVRETEGALTRTAFTVKWDAAPEDAALLLMWEKPLVDIQYQWHSKCGADRAMKPNWCAPVESKLSSGCPLHVFFNEAGRNRYTVALSDCVNRVERNMGLSEENAELECRVRIPLHREAGRYEVTLWIDETDCRYEDAVRAVSAWWETLYPPMDVPEYAKLPMYSCWYSFHQDVRADEVEREAVRAAELGMKSLIMDDGWQTDNARRGYAQCGDWKPYAPKIPDMRAHVDAVHAAGLKYLLWFSVPFLGKEAVSFERFRGMTLEMIEEHGACTLDPRYPEVREYLIETYVNAVKNWNLDGLKLDFIDSFRMKKTTPAFAEGMDISNLEDAVHRLMVDVRAALQAVRPDILIEFRQSYIGPVMREYGNMFRVGDCPNATIVNRVGMVDLRLTSGNTAVHSDMLMWHENDRVENAVCQIENALFAVMQLSVRLDRVPEEHKKAVRFWTEFMTEHRELLLDAPLYADSPQNLYPVVRTERDGKSVIAVYQENRVVDLPASKLDEVWIVSANAGKSVLLRADTAAEWEIVARNCLGDAVDETVRMIDGLAEIAAPECGMLHLKKR